MASYKKTYDRYWRKIPKEALSQKKKRRSTHRN